MKKHLFCFLKLQTILQISIHQERYWWSCVSAAKYFNPTNRYEDFQSGFRSHHSSDSNLKVSNDICINADYGRTTVLVMLDLSAVFDTIDRSN